MELKKKLIYNTKNKTIAMIKKFLLRITSSLILLFCLQTAFAQNRTVTGTILDASGVGIPGVTVSVKGSNRATQTSSNGTYTIEAPENGSLIVSAVGYATRELRVSGIDSSIRLETVTTSLNEVVVTGYGTARRRDITGSIGSVSEKDFNKGTYTSADQLIQGKVAGVQVTNNTGQPGSATTVKIRGNSAITGNGQPLYVLDGVPLDGRSVRPGVGGIISGSGNPGSNPLNFINPSDIVSIDVLKDASATAIYGSRAAYGVVLITTKKGQTGQTKIEFGASLGFSSVLDKIDVLDASQYREALRYYGVSNSNDKGGNIDAFDEITRTGMVQNYNVGISGGTENAKYRFSLGALDQEGIVRKTGIKKYTADFSGQFRFLEKRNLGIDINVIPSQYSEEIAPITNDAGAEGSLIGQALQWNPTLPLVVKKANGADSIVNVGGTSIINPLGISEAYDDKSRVTTLLASVSPYFKFTSWLEYRFLYSVNYGTGNRRTSIKPDINIAAYQGKGFARIAENELTTQQFTHTLNFNKKIASLLNLNAVAGFEYLKYQSRGFNLSAVGRGDVPGGFGNYGLDYTNYIQFGNNTNRGISSFVDPSYELQSYFARTVFNYNDKYVATATIRRDGSTKFGENNKYGNFPSFGLAWIVSKEDFFNVDFINSLKIRGGWGKTGNQEFPSGSAQARFSLGGNGAISQINNPNPDLRWQSDRQYNIGIDFSVLKNRVTATVDYFNKQTTDLLFPSAPAQPAAPGAPIRWVNLDGNIDNKGVEASVNASIINQNDFSWDFSVNAAFIDNNVSGLSSQINTGRLSGQGSSGTTIQVIQNGLPINAFFTRQFLGFDKASGLANYSENGDVLFYVGDPNPSTLLGLSTSVRYKKLTLIANMNGAFGHRIYNETLSNVINVGSINGGRNIALSVFRDPVKESFANPVTASSRFLEKGNYLKMTNATLAYGIGNFGKIFKGANIYITGQNLFVITKYTGFDPEVNVDKNLNGVPSVGIEYIPYPSARTITFGINFSL